MSMMVNDYGEPWRKNSIGMAVKADGSYVGDDKKDETLARIIACVNALAGAQDPAAWVDAIQKKAFHHESRAFDLEDELRDAVIERDNARNNAELFRNSMNAVENELIKVSRELADARRSLDIAKKELSDTRDFLRRKGYRRCDSAACNCGSWHKVYEGAV